MKYLYLIPLLFVSIEVSGQSDGSLKKDIDKLLNEEHLTGVVWAIVSDGGTMTNASGIKNLETGEVMKPSTAVQIGSITKSFVALGVLRLATENKLDLDTPIREYLKNLPFENPWSSSTPITVRHLLDHTSGLSDLAIWQFFSTSSSPDTPLANAFEKNTSLLQVHTEPGRVFSYSNMGYTLLGMVVESVTGQKYEGYLDKNLLLPLGMTESTFQFVSQVGENANENLAMGHYEDGTIVSSLPIYLRPAGQFTTTASDMSRFLKFLMGDGTLENGEKFIKPSLFKGIANPTSTDAAFGGLSNGYSYGVLKRDFYNTLSLSHSGNIIGYKAYYHVFPEENKAFFTSFNIDHESADYQKINKRIIDYLNIEKKIPNPISVNMDEDLKSWSGYYIPIFEQFVPYRLLDYLGGFTKFSANQNTSELQRFQGSSQRLKYIGNNQFIADNRVMASHLLYEDESGTKLITTGTSTLKKTSLFKISLIFGSFVLGAITLGASFIIGLVQLIRNRVHFFKKPLAPAFIVITVMIISFVLLADQPFIEIGNITLGSVLLAVTSTMLPITAIYAAYRFARNNSKPISNVQLLLSLMIIQFTFLLFIFDMIPFTLWG